MTDQQGSIDVVVARSWLDKNARRRSADQRRVFSLAEAKEWQERLYRAGLVGLTYPREYGGGGLGQSEARPIDELVQEYDLPFEYFAIGLGMCGPILISEGTEEQKRRYAGRLLDGSEIWCQLFSEPAAGSDVAALRTRAVPAEGGWVINGQKVWSSGAHHSDYGILLARTDPDVPKHRGITMFILKMNTPGVTVRPIKQITGRSRFNEVFFDDVFIEDSAVLGGIGDGWLAALRTLSVERSSVSSWDWNRPPTLTAQWLYELRAKTGRVTQSDLRELAALYASEVALGSLVRMQKRNADAGLGSAAHGSLAKVAESMHKDLSVSVASSVAIAELVCRDPADAGTANLLTDVLGTRGSSIAGGTDEIQHNIIGERLLGLPSEPRVDKTLPFRDLPTGRVGSERAHGQR